MKKVLAFMGLGAGLMYLFDPELGEIRRSMLQDKLSGRLPNTVDAVHAKAEEVHAKVGEIAHKADEAAADVIANASLPSADSVRDAVEDAVKKADDKVGEAVDKAKQD